MAGGSKTYRNNNGAGRNGYWLTGALVGRAGTQAPAPKIVGWATGANPQAAYDAARNDAIAKVGINPSFHGSNGLVIDGGMTYNPGGVAPYTAWLVVTPDVDATWTPYFP